MNPCKVSRLLAVPIVVGAFTTIECDGRSTDAGSPIPFSDVYRERYSGIAVQRGEVISTPERWQAAWDEITAAQLPQPSLPFADFGKTSLVLVSQGENPDACWTIEIETVREEPPRLHVTAANIRAPASCSCPPTTVQPVHVVAVQTALKVGVFDFKTTTRGAECN